MGASRKLQGEIDRVLKKVQEGVDVFDSIWNKVYDTDNANQKEKFEVDLKKEIKKLQRYRDQIKTWIQSSEIKDKKVSASYEQALLDARKLIEREMERFKVCEKETKTKAFSKEGLGQQPKADPKEKAKSETRDWLNNVVGELESQIDNFEAEVEGFSVRKGKTRPPQLTHLETSIVRHKAHIIKLELILRLLDNDELSPEQVNDVRDFLEDYVERNQEDFDEFSDVDELYNSLPLDKVESLEDLVAIAPSALIKGVSSIPTASTVLNLKTSVAATPTQTPELAEETASPDSNSDTAPRTPNKSGGMVSSVFLASSGIGYTSAGTNTVGATPSCNLIGASTYPAILSCPGYTRGAMEDAPASVSSSAVNLSNSMKEDENASLSGRRSTPALAEIGIGKGIGRGSVVSGLSSQVSGVPLNLSSGSSLPSNGSLGGAPTVSDIAKRNILGVDERIGNGSQSALSNRTLLQQVSRTIDGSISTDSNSIGETATIGRAFSPSMVSGVQWRPQSPSSFQNQNEMREKFLQRLQQVQQQGHSNLLGVPSLPGANNKQFPTQHQNSLLQQQHNALHQQSTHHALLLAERVADSSPIKMEDQLQQQNSFADLNVELTRSADLKNLMNEDDLKVPYVGGGTGCSTDVTQVSRDIDLSSGQPLQLNQSSAGLGVIGSRSGSDLGAIGDNLSVSAANTAGMFDQLHNLQMLEAAYYRLPQRKDSECPKNYIPRHPAKTPVSYPQVQAPIVDNPAFWERVSLDNMGADNLFFAFYYQQNTYQQYLAARELKKQSWRYHRKYNTWFQRHEEPKVTTDEYEQGTYVYFDFYIANDDSRQGWCQRIKTEFTFEYSYLEDELVV